MKNVSIKTVADTLTITIDLKHSLGLSKSGKSNLIASSEGQYEIPEAPGVFIGLNVYKKV